MGKPLKDMTGMKFGRLSVVRRADKNRGTGAAWHCKCDCGNESDVGGYDLRSGNTKSCGCLVHEPSKSAIDLSGLVIGGISVIKRSATVGGSTMWECKCSCGNIFSAKQWDIRHGRVSSCGCLTKEKISKANSYNLIGKRFGKLIVAERVGSNKWRKAIWRCVCDCGNENIVPTDSLVWGGTRSCGCLYYDVVVTHGMTHTKEYKRIKANHRKEMSIIYDCEWTVNMEVALRDFFRRCVVCDSDKKLSTAHVYSLKTGNGLRPGNAVVLCMSCNSKQWIYPPENLPKSLPADAGIKILDAASKFKGYWESIQ